MTDRFLALLLLAGTTGCMRIYPDPELPDVIVEWLADCRDDGATVRLEAIAPDGTVVRHDGGCNDHTGRLEDLERTTHAIRGSLLDASGEVLGRSEPVEVDLAAGTSRRTYLSLFSRDGGFVSIGWAFAGGDTCSSLGVENITVDLRAGQNNSSIGGWCAFGKLDYFYPVEAGTYTMQVVANRTFDGAVVAVSEVREGVVVPDRGQVVDLGSIALTRCEGECKRLPPPDPRGPDGPDRPDGPDGPGDGD